MMDESRSSPEERVFRALLELAGRTYLETGQMPGFKALEAMFWAMGGLLEGGDLPEGDAGDREFVSRLLLTVQQIDDEPDAAGPFLAEIAGSLRAILRQMS